MKHLIISIIILFSTLNSSYNENYKPVTVLELFTSQGCSSCPPADILLNKVKNEHSRNVIVLSYHVDYWNYIGWKDPFAKKEFSDKQRFYADKFYSNSIYTPQLVVNGKEHFVGSNKYEMNSRLKKYNKISSKNTIAITGLKKENHIIDFIYQIEGDIKNKRMRVALVIDNRITVVKRGENKNRTLSNSNIVVEEFYINLDKNKGKGTIVIPDLVNKEDKLSIVTLIENKAFDIVGGKQTYL